VDLLNCENSIAIVGTRECTNYGRKYACEFARELASRGVCIVSGMAVGIDMQAHIGAIDAGGDTIAVLGCGFNHIYPAENEWLFHKILKNNGCIVTEYGEDERAKMMNFPKRNRIIAGLSEATLVVEAKGGRTGSAVTADRAKKQGKEVFCIPSNIDSVVGNGTNELIRQGATLVTNPKQILDRVHKEENAEKKVEVDIKKHIPEEYSGIYEILENSTANINEISKRLNLPTSQINSTITMMELEGYVERISGNQLKIARGL